MIRFLRRTAALAAGALLLVACTPALAAPTGGTGGELTDRPDKQSFTAGGITSTYQLFAGGLDWTREVGLLLYTDGSGGYGIDNPNATYLLDADGTAGLVAVAKRHNMLLLVPEAPAPGCPSDNCWYNGSGSPNAIAKADWARALVDHVYSQYNVETGRVAIGGYSSGAQFTMRYFGPKHGAAVQKDGVLVAIGGGGTPIATPTFTPEYKSAVVGVWNTGTADKTRTYSAYEDAQRGSSWYRNNGFQVDATWPEGVGHSRGGEFAGIMDAAITAHVRPAQTLGTTPTEPVSTAYATTVTPTDAGVRFDIQDVPAGAPATYVRVRKVSDGTEKYLYTTATGDIVLTFVTLGTAGEDYTYRVFAGSSTSVEPKATGAFTTWSPPVPGDRDGDRDVDYDDLRALADARPDDTDLRDIADNWTP